MTGFDDFDDDETVIHGAGRGAAPDAFDDDDTFVASTRGQDTLPPPSGPRPGPSSHPGPSPRHGSDPHPGPDPHRPVDESTFAARPDPDGVRSIATLRDQAPLGPGWRPPERPTSYEAAASEGSLRSGRVDRLQLIALVIGLAVVGCAVAVGAWLLLTDSGVAAP